MQGDFLDALAPVKSAASSNNVGANVKADTAVIGGLKPNAGWGKKKDDNVADESAMSDARVAAIVTEMTEPFRKTILELVQVILFCSCSCFFFF